jgi:hypothetical protein
MAKKPTNAERQAAVAARHARMQGTPVARIAQQLTQLDGLCLDNAPERRKLARWIAANFTPKGCA